MESRYWKFNGRAYVRAQSGEIRGEKNAQRFGDADEPFVSGAERSLHFARGIKRQHRLIYLNPCRSGFAQPSNHALVDRKNAFQQGKGVEVWLLPLSKKEKRYRAEQYRTCVNAQRFCLQEFVNGFQRTEGKLLVFRELGNYVVVVCVEPLCHLHR